MKALVLLSGGLDSTVLLAQVVESWPKSMVGAISFNYGQRHAKELLAAVDVVRYYGVEHHKIVDISYFRPLLGGSALMGTQEVPHGHFEDPVQAATIVNNRNMILISLAVAYAKTAGFTNVFTATHKGDHAVYPDCRLSFIEHMAAAVEIASDGEIKFHAPFQIYDKAGIVKRGRELYVPFDLTWSCYEGRDQECGQCGACQERKMAMEA